MQTTATGCTISTPEPTPSASGSRPRIVVSAVISTGRKRIRTASTMASRAAMPSARRRLMQSISTMPLLTTTPTSMIMPTMDTMLTSIPAISSAINPPVNASGMVNMTMNGDSSD